jgi:osmoprotectant transport system permease protein
VIDIYSTDAKVGRYHLRVLTDDRQFFPRYEAVLLMRAAIDPSPLREPRGASTLAIALNARSSSTAAVADVAGLRRVAGRAHAARARRFVDRISLATSALAST